MKRLNGYLRADMSFTVGGVCLPSTSRILLPAFPMLLEFPTISTSALGLQYVFTLSFDFIVVAWLRFRECSQDVAAVLQTSQLCPRDRAHG